MKVARFYAPGDIRIEDAPEPIAGPGRGQDPRSELLDLRHGRQDLPAPGTRTSTRPGSWATRSPARSSRSAPTSGRPANGRPWAVGDRVQVIAAVPVRPCPDCLRGWMTICPNQTSIGYQYEGGFAEYLIVPHEVLRVDGLNLIPDGVGFDEASVAEPFACAINAQELARVGRRRRRRGHRRRARSAASTSGSPGRAARRGSSSSS